MPSARFRHGPGLQLWPLRSECWGLLGEWPSLMKRGWAPEMSIFVSRLYNVTRGAQSQLQQQDKPSDQADLLRRAEPREITWVAPLTNLELTNVGFRDTWDKCPYKASCHLQLKHPNTSDRNRRNDRDKGSQRRRGDTTRARRREPEQELLPSMDSPIHRFPLIQLLKHNWHIKL